MPTSSFVRNAGILCIAGALIAMAANALSARAEPAHAGGVGFREFTLPDFR